MMTKTKSAVKGLALALSASLFFFPAVSGMADGPAQSGGTSGSSNYAPAPQDNRTVTVSGTVTDASGAPLIGAGILQKGNTSNGVISDVDGKFTLTVPAGSEIEISCIGYTSKTFKAGSVPSTVVLEEDSQLLDETVVVGYGVQKKSVVTGSISQVKAEDMMISSNTRPEQALQGKTSGVQVISSSGAPGSSMKIRIRGYSSNGNSDPLYIVDGLRTTDISTLEPSNIESMEVLKDGASAAIYGAEGGNGVILITTKQGSSGRTSINYDFQYTLQSLGRTAKIMDAKQYLEYMHEGGALPSSVTYNGIDTDWIDETFETSPMMKHNLSISGGNEKVTYMGSISYLDQKGIVVGDQDNYKRFSGMFNGSVQAKKWLKFSSNIQINRSVTTSFNMNDNSRGVLSNALQLDPLTPVYYESDDNLPSNVQAIINSGHEPMRDSDGHIYGISQYVTGEAINPLVQRSLYKPKNTMNNLTSNVQADITPLEGLMFTSRLGVRYYDMNAHSYRPGFYYSTEMNNLNPSVSETDGHVLYHQWENFANYSKSIGNHNFSVMVGMSMSEFYNKVVGASGYPLMKDQESYADLNYITSQAGDNVSGSQQRDRKFSYYGRLNYDYKGKYLFEATLRRDAAGLSILPKDKRWGTFPAVSLGWVATREDWFPKTDWLDYLKVRASWGQNGSLSNLGDYSYSSVISSSGSALNFVTWSMLASSYLYPLADGSFGNASWPSTLGNYDLTWETSEQTDLGIDLRFFKSKLTFTLDAYIKKTRNLITTNTPPLEAGNSASPINGGDVENKGIDLELGWRSNIGDFNYSINGNISFLHNEVTYLDPSISRISGAGLMQWTGATAFEKGHPVWYMRGYKTDGIDKETGKLNIVDVNNDGSITTDDYTEIGSAIPTATYGLTLAGSWNGFDATVFISGQWGNDILYGARRPDRTTVNKLSTFYKNRWTESNHNAKYPSAYEQTNTTQFWNSDMMVFDGSFMKIKQIQLGYTLPKQLSDRVNISKCRVYVSLDNFLCFTDYPGMDPEAASTSNSAIGIDQGYYPQSRNVLFGLQLSF